MSAPREYASDHILKLARSRAVVLRALKVAIVVGVVLAFINHGDRLMTMTFDIDTIWRVLLTFCVPYSVSTYSSVVAVREYRARQMKKEDAE